MLFLNSHTSVVASWHHIRPTADHHSCHWALWWFVRFWLLFRCQWLYCPSLITLSFPFVPKQLNFCSLPLMLCCFTHLKLFWVNLVSLLSFSDGKQLSFSPPEAWLTKKVQIRPSRLPDTLVFVELITVIHIENLLFTYTSPYVSITVY